MKPIVLGPGEGETISDRAERNVIVKCDHELADVTWTRYEPGEVGPDPHIHKQHADAWYVLEGELTFGLGPGGEELRRASAGSLVLVPAGVIHTFRNEGPRAARFLNIHAPSMGFAQSLRTPGFQWDSFDPPADGGRSTSDAVLRGPGEGKTVESRSVVSVKAGRGDGDGQLTALDAVLPAGYPGPPLHLHRQTAEALFTLEGTIAVRLGDEQLSAQPGSFVFLPPGVPHTFANPDGAPARCLALASPGGIEGFLQAAAQGDGAVSGAPYDTYTVEA